MSEGNMPELGSQWEQVKDLFHRALELHPASRPAFLETHCGGKPELRREVEALLESSREAGDFLEDGPLPVADPFLGESFGPYRAVEEIGEGGMGVVYRGVRDLDGYQQEVAIKVVRRGMASAGVLRRFRRESRILARLDHPHISRLLDAGVTPDGTPYFVMEYVPGPSIRDYCLDKQPGLRARLELFLQVCAAVEYAHRNLVIHRDIKAGNVVITPSGTAKLLDFGIATMLEEDETVTRAAAEAATQLMTPDYASPEQVRGEPMGTSSDIYSLGVLLYEVLTCRKPYEFSGRPAAEIVRLIAEVQPARPSRVAKAGERAAIQGDLDVIALKAMEKLPEERYATVHDFAEDIRRYLAGLPVRARPATLAYRLRKYVRRHRGGVAAASMAGALILALTGTAVWQAGVAAARRAEARERFNDLRKMAGTLLTEVDGQLATLPGATPSRETILRRVLEYLDSLARADVRDRDLQLELSAAYERLADVQGGTKASNLGHTEDAIRSYRKSVGIAERLLAGSTSREALRELSRKYSKLSDVMALSGDHLGARDMDMKSLDLRRRWLRQDPGDREAQRALAASFQEVAGDYERLGDWAKVDEFRREALGMLEDLHAGPGGDRELDLALALANKRLGRNLQREKKFEEAEVYCQRALAIERALLDREPANAQANMSLSFTLNLLGAIAGDAGRLGEARRWLEEALRIRQALVEADPKDVRAKSALSTTLLRLGETHLKAGAIGAARPHLERSLAIRLGLAAIDPRNAGARGEVAEASAALGELERAAGRRAKTAAYWQQARDIYLDLRRQGSLSAEYQREPERLEALLRAAK